MPDLPPQGDNGWYAHYTAMDAKLRTIATKVTRTPEQYGAVGDGVTDDQAALNAMLAALTPGSEVVLKKQYRHSNVLPILVPNTTWYFEGDLIASNRQAASLQIGAAAKGTRMFQPRHRVLAWDKTGNARGGTDTLTAPFAIYDTEDIELYDAFSQHSAQCGLYLSTVHGYHIERPVIDRSYADGFHQTHNCEDGYVVDALVTRPGDDGVAVVSYLTRGTGGAAVDPCRRINIVRPTVKFCHARGVSVVGGTDVTYSDIDVYFTRAAGAMIASESGYNTHPAIRCVVEGGSVRHVGYPVAPNEVAAADAALDHGALFLLSQQVATPVVDSGFMDVEVSDMGSVPYQYLRPVVNNSATFTNCFFRRNTVLQGYEGRSGVSLQGSGVQTGVTFDGNVDARQILGTPRLGADVSNTTTSTSNVGIGFSNVQPGDYEFEVEGFYTCAATTTGIKFNWGYSGSQSRFLSEFEVAVSTTALLRGVTTATNTEFNSGTASLGTTVLPFHVKGVITVTANTVLDFKFGSTVAGSAATVKAGTFARLTRIG